MKERFAALDVLSVGSFPTMIPRSSRTHRALNRLRWLASLTRGRFGRSQPAGATLTTNL